MTTPLWMRQRNCPTATFTPICPVPAPSIRKPLRSSVTSFASIRTAVSPPEIAMFPGR